VSKHECATELYFAGAITTVLRAIQKILGGSYGPLNGTWGLAADNLFGAEIVLADGRLLTIGPETQPDLYWALRGGGGNFGVVTSLRVRLHPARDMLAGSIVYNWNEAERVLRRYAAFAATAPDELGVPVGLMPGPDGEPVIMVVPLWNGERRQGERVMEDVRAFGAPQSAQLGPASSTRGWRPRTATTLRPERAGCPRSPQAPPRRSSRRRPRRRRRCAWSFGTTSTALQRGWRRIARHSACAGEHLMVEIVAGWKPDGDDAAAHRRWAHDLWQSLAPFALPGGYANLLGPDNREQAAGAYGGMLPGSGPSSGALIPMASSRPPFRCRSCLKHNRTLLP
jgi:hypothetical protein